MINSAITTSNWLVLVELDWQLPSDYLNLRLRVLVVEKTVDLPYRVASYP